MLKKRLDSEAQRVAVDANHLECVAALRQTGKIANLNGIEVVPMNTGDSRYLLQAEALALALSLEKPACLADRIGGPIGARPVADVLRQGGVGCVAGSLVMLLTRLVRRLGIWGTGQFARVFARRSGYSGLAQLVTDRFSHGTFSPSCGLTESMPKNGKQ